jgi:cytochrome c oxidase subunit 2
MNKKEVLALTVALAIVVGLPAGVLAYQRILRVPASAGVQAFDLVARAPEAGGWSPEILTVNQGDTVRLRISSPDVVHGFAIGRLGIDVGRIVPGEVTAVEFVADRAGRYTFYCNVWCSPNHYRMRGTLVVVDPDEPAARPATTVEAEGVPADLDIDAPHRAQQAPVHRPSALQGRRLSQGVDLPAVQNLRSTSPSDVFLTLRQTPSPGHLSDAQLWDLVAFLWAASTTPERLLAGQALYAKNCVGCHGATGRGDGPGSRSLEQAPTDFTAAETMAGGTSDIYYAKIRRGGMGTGMPYWGTIFTEEETQSLVDYLWTFLFEDLPAAAPRP